jgi:hypothetical protein
MCHAQSADAFHYVPNAEIDELSPKMRLETPSTDYASPYTDCVLQPTSRT